MGCGHPRPPMDDRPSLPRPACNDNDNDDFHHALMDAR